MSIDENRFEAAMTTAQFVAQMQTNQELFISNYALAVLDEADIAFFRAQGPLRVLALAEDWCIDVVTALPALAKLADALGDDLFRLRVLSRDQNLDLASAYTKEGSDQAIPVFVFFDAQMRERGYFIERPAALYGVLDRAEAEFVASHPEYAGPRGQRSEAASAAISVYRRQYRASHRHEVNKMLFAGLRQLLAGDKVVGDRAWQGPTPSPSRGEGSGLLSRREGSGLHYRRVSRILRGGRVETILVVEDEPTLLDTLKYNLVKAGYNVRTAQDGLEALQAARAARPNLILLDLMLPGLDGIEVCRLLRRESDVPIIMLTARDEEIDKVLGLELGADDYVTKPFSLRELLARVKALLRRNEAARTRTEVKEQPGGAKGGLLRVANLILDPNQHRAARGGVELNLKPREFDLLAFLMLNQGQVFSREQLLDKVWGYEYVGDSRTVDVHVRWLREKIEVDPSDPRLLETVRGVGYRLNGNGK
jgi:DNA-binding response OmpR family regulator